MPRASTRIAGTLVSNGKGHRAALHEFCQECPRLVSGVTSRLGLDLDLDCCRNRCLDQRVNIDGSSGSPDGHTQCAPNLAVVPGEIWFLFPPTSNWINGNRVSTRQFGSATTPII